MNLVLNLQPARTNLLVNLGVRTQPVSPVGRAHSIAVAAHTDPEAWALPSRPGGVRQRLSRLDTRHRFRRRWLNRDHRLAKVLTTALQPSPPGLPRQRLAQLSTCGPLPLNGV